MGLTLVNRDSSVAGAFPESDDNSDRVDWLMRDRSEQMAGSISDMTQRWRKTWDLKTQRVVRDVRTSLWLILDHSAGGGVEYFWTSRVLMKLA